MTIKSNSGSIPLSDFYNDPSSTSTLSNSFGPCSYAQEGELPKGISNLRGDPSTNYQSYSVSNCLFKLCKHVISMCTEWGIQWWWSSFAYNYFQFLQILEYGRSLLEDPSESFTLDIWYNSGADCFKGDSFESTISTNEELLQRARDDITSIYDVDPNEVTPEYLLIYQFNDARVKTSTAEV